jgi:phosphatidylserine decarboxylase
MHFARQGYPWILGLGSASLVFGLLELQAVSLPLLGLTLFAAWFFRDPRRLAPEGERLVLAPADGRVVAVESGVSCGAFPSEPVSRLSIFMSPLDVHVNRVPVSGRVLEVRHRRGQFRPAFSPEASDVNEQNAVVIEDRGGRRVLLVQVAGMLARRIFCTLKAGDEVTGGQRYGMIAFGSRIDLYHRPDLRVRVNVGERVKAGETVIGEYP